MNSTMCAPDRQPADRLGVARHQRVDVHARTQDVVAAGVDRDEVGPHRQRRLDLLGEDRVHLAPADREVRVAEVVDLGGEHGGDPVGPAANAVGQPRVMVADALGERVTEGDVPVEGARHGDHSSGRRPQSDRWYAPNVRVAASRHDHAEHRERRQAWPHHRPVGCAEQRLAAGDHRPVERVVLWRTSGSSPGASDGSMIAEDRNVIGRLRNWLMPIRASCWRAIRAIALDSAAQITVSRHADDQRHDAPRGRRRRTALPRPRRRTSTITVCTMLVSDW